MCLSELCFSLYVAGISHCYFNCMTLTGLPTAFFAIRHVLQMWSTKGGSTSKTLISQRFVFFFLPPLCNFVDVNKNENRMLSSFTGQHPSSKSDGCCLSLSMCLSSFVGDGNGTPLRYSCLENPMDGGAWWTAVHGVAKSQTRLSDFTFTFHFHALEKEMATHSSVLAWRIPGTGEPGELPSMGSHRVGHDWSNLAAAAASSFVNLK